MKPKKPKKNGKSFVLLAIIIIAVVAIFAFFIYRFLQYDKTEFEIHLPEGFACDFEYNRKTRRLCDRRNIFSVNNQKA